MFYEEEVMKRVTYTFLKSKTLLINGKQTKKKHKKCQWDYRNLKGIKKELNKIESIKILK